jgi:hypothetical protein
LAAGLIARRWGAGCVALVTIAAVFLYTAIAGRPRIAPIVRLAGVGAFLLVRRRT